jgi:hypothetical protein
MILFEEWLRQGHLIYKFLLRITKYRYFLIYKITLYSNIIGRRTIHRWVFAQREFIGDNLPKKIFN